MSRTPEQSAFHKVLEAYYQAKTNQTGNCGGFFADLGRSVNRNNGKVQPCPSDLIADVELAARRALRGYPSEHGAFTRIYLDLDNECAKSMKAGMGEEIYKHFVSEIEQRVGAEFMRVGIYPLSDYRRAVDTR